MNSSHVANLSPGQAVNVSVDRRSHFRCLDLFCGEGLASWGYWRSGRFSEIVGVDINPEMSARYSFNFLCADALTLNYEFLDQFDFIHASPPCQAYSTVTPAWARERHMRLIAATHLMLYATGKPYVIENVPGAKRELRPNVEMNGLYFGLPSDRPRFFFVSALEQPAMLTKRGRGWRIHGGEYVERDKLIEAFGLREMIGRHRLKQITREGIKQGIPPIFTYTLAKMLFPSKFLIGDQASNFPGGEQNPLNQLVLGSSPRGVTT